MCCKTANCTTAHLIVYTTRTLRQYRFHKYKITCFEISPFSFMCCCKTSKLQYSSCTQRIPWSAKYIRVFLCRHYKCIYMYFVCDYYICTRTLIRKIFSCISMSALNVFICILYVIVTYVRIPWSAKYIRVFICRRYKCIYMYFVCDCYICTRTLIRCRFQKCKM